MPVQQSPPAGKASSQARAQAVLTPTPKAPLDGTPEVPQLRAHLDKGTNMESEPDLLAIMQQMTQIITNLQAALSYEASRTPALKTSSMKAPEFFDGTQPFKVRSFIQSCQCIFHNYQETFSEGRKKVLYATSFLIGRAEKWIEPSLSNLTNRDLEYLLSNGA
ncbi:hypothetical protein O181_002720 [Austropuccinia psidii MF-1]|uniref:DUF4939 domain-containing protein n=1 Tax=Austropuccinia psidii MF-1 TaxID=1389203 RepID=A0A9Q3BDJ7_9BASI|nr:hypothetical protein [Austropuccinia psidii MF-1]